MSFVVLKCTTHTCQLLFIITANFRPLKVQYLFVVNTACSWGTTRSRRLMSGPLTDEAQLPGSDVPVSCDLLRPSSVELDLVHRPHGSFHVLQTDEALVQAQVVPDGILKCKWQNKKKKTSFLRPTSIIFWCILKAFWVVFRLSNYCINHNEQTF